MLLLENEAEIKKELYSFDSGTAQVTSVNSGPLLEVKMS
jgi:hypothetical protein